MQFKEPVFQEQSFNCPICGAHAHMAWNPLYAGRQQSMYYEAQCHSCGKSSLWRATEVYFGTEQRHDDKADMIFPDNGFSVPPEQDMPEDVKADYEEAARIIYKSPRGAAALLRLGLQKLCKHLGQDGNNINSNIRSLAAENILSPLVIKVADTVRITGNNAVHPGEMSDEDIDHVALKTFGLLNFIVKKGISEPKELLALYERTPERPRESAEKDDAKSKTESD